MTKILIALIALSSASLAAVIEPSPAPAPTAAGATLPADEAKSAEQTRKEFTEDALAPTIKPARYDVTIVEFSDYQCPFCRKAHPELKRLFAADKKVRIIYRDWPIFGDASVAAARVAIASNWQGKHGAVHDALMKTPRPLNDATIKAAAIKAGASWPRLQADMKAHGPEIDTLLARNNDQAEMLGLQGTPAFIVGNYLVEGGLDLKGLKAAVRKARTVPAPPIAAATGPEGI